MTPLECQRLQDTLRAVAKRVARGDAQKEARLLAHVARVPLKPSEPNLSEPAKRLLLKSAQKGESHEAIHARAILQRYGITVSLFRVKVKYETKDKPSPRTRVMSVYTNLEKPSDEELRKRFLEYWFGLPLVGEGYYPAPDYEVTELAHITQNEVITHAA